MHCIALYLRFWETGVLFFRKKITVKMNIQKTFYFCSRTNCGFIP